MKKILLLSILSIFLFLSCNKNKINNLNYQNIEDKTFSEVSLDTTFSSIDNNTKQMLYYLAKASDYVDSIYFYTNFEDYSLVLDTIKNENIKKKYIFNAGPWDRFVENKPFVSGIGDKPKGANFYPKDIKQLEFYEMKDICKESPYTFLRRNKNNQLYCVPYHKMYTRYIDSITLFMREAAKHATDKNFSDYLVQRASDIENDSYHKSDSMWVLLTKSTYDFIIGPIYVTDDKFLNIKYDYQSYLLVKNEEWTKKMEKYNKWLKFLQKALPVAEKYRAEEPGESSSIAVYDALYYGGAGKYGGTMFSIVLPLDPQIQLDFGVRNIQFKNIIEKKFNAITLNIAKNTFTPEQQKHITADAFFVNAIMYEMANSLGIRNTINNKGTVRKALKNYYVISDYIKNYLLVLFLAEKLSSVGEIQNDLEDNYFTFVANLIRLIRFGTANEYGLSSLIIFNYLIDNQAIKFTKDGTSLNFEKMQTSINELIAKILILQGDGDIDNFKIFVEDNNKMSVELKNLIEKINSSNVPTDIIINQNKNIFSLTNN